MYASLREFVLALDRAGELARVRTRVSPVLEISAIADRVSKLEAPGSPAPADRHNDPAHAHLGGKALLFENVEGSQTPLLINAFGSYRRVQMALGATRGLDVLAAKIGELVKPAPPRSLREALGFLRRVLPLLRTPPKRRKGPGPCQEVVVEGEAADLCRLPLIRCWPQDGDPASVGYPADVNEGIPGLGSGPEWDQHFRGRYITLGGVHTIHADDRDDPKPASHNIGMYRAQLLGPRRLAMHWHVHHDGARHWRSWKALGRPMPVAIALGGESVLPYAATAPLPPGISELLLAGYLNGRGIEMVRARTVPLWVPANAEIVIEGWVSHEAGHIGYDPRRDGPVGPGAVFEGPFGDHTGFYSLPDRYPIMDVSAVTCRRDPIYPTTVVGLPVQEDYFLGKATERLFLPLLRTILPDVEDYDLPAFGAFHNCAFLKVRKSYPLQARRLMHGVWGAGQMSWTKTIFVVDEDVNVHDGAEVLRAAAANCRPGTDLEQVRGPLDILDHAAPVLGAGTKLGFDCTRRWPAEVALGGQDSPPAPPPPAITPELLALVKGLPGVVGVAEAWVGTGWLLVAADKSRAGQGREMIERLSALPGLPRFVIVVGSEVDVTDPEAALFHWLAHSDAGRDAQVRAGVWLVDATPKLPGDEAQGFGVRDWPPILRWNTATRARLGAKWSEIEAQVAGHR